MRVDHGRNRVGCIVEAVDEFKAEGDQQCNEEQDVRKKCGGLHAGRFDVFVDAVGDKEQSGCKDAEEDQHRQWVEAFIEVRPRGRFNNPAI